jgi:predicted RNA-binding Zn ribbon-like protein
MSQSSIPFQFIAGALCLDFVNTVGSHTSFAPAEKLREVADLVRWAHEARIVDRQGAQELLSFSESHPHEASGILERARAFRESLFRIFAALNRQERPNDIDLTALNETLRSFPIHLQVRLQGQEFSCRREMVQSGDARLLAPVAWSAADLLASDQVHQVRQCASATCGWFFVDTTKNHSRRWCMMSDCGSLAKAKRYYQRKKTKNLTSRHKQ